MDITALLEFKQTVKSYYYRFETYIRYAARFVLALICTALINGRMGYYAKFSGFPVTFALSLICAVLPAGFTAFICAVLILVHLYALSLEACAIAAVMFLCIYLLYYRFSTHDAIVILLTPVLFTFHIPAVMPFLLGLLFLPFSVVSMSFGVLIWFFLHNIAGNVSQYANAEGGAEEHLSRVQDIAGTMASDRTMLVYVAAFAVSALVIYFMRRQSFDRAVPVAIGAGAFVNLLILLVGDVMLDASVGVAGAFLGTLLGVAVAVVIMFFAFHLDYSRVEKVQFEDEEYYYYVKAVPKVVLRERQVRSKSINRSLDTSESFHIPHAERVSLSAPSEDSHARSRSGHAAQHAKQSAARHKTAHPHKRTAAPRSDIRDRNRDTKQ